VIRRERRAVAGFVGTVLAIGLGSAALLGASSETCAGLMLLVTCGVLLLSTIGAACRGPGARPRFLGFAMFGWGYFALAHWYSYYQAPMPTVCFLPGSGGLHGPLRSQPPLVRIAHDAWALAFAIFGSTLAGRLFQHSSPCEQGHTPDPPLDADVAGWWRKPVWPGLLGFGLVVAAAVAGLWTVPEIGAGAAFLLTWAVVGLAILGAAFARGRRREAWFGAASFGAGYLILAFGPAFATVLPTNHLLNAVFRPGGPTKSEPTDDEFTTDEESRRVKKALDEPISLHFPVNTPLKTVLNQVKNAIRPTLGKDVVIDAPRHAFRPLPGEFDELLVSIDCKNTPAKDALRLCLSPLGMTYRIQSGDVRISPDTYQPLPFEEDPVMIAGHSLLAWVAAAAGGVVAPIVAGFCGRRGSNRGRDPADAQPAIGDQANS
jgi:hypothetical protein